MRAGIVAARWALAAVFIGGMAIGLALGATPGRSQVIVLAFLAYAAVGWLVTTRKPENAIGWLFLTVAALTGLGAVQDGLSRHALAAGDPWSTMGQWGAWLNGWFWILLVCCATVFTLLLFPDGLLSRRWRPVLWLSVATCALLTLAGALAPQVTLEGAMNSAGHCLGGVFPSQQVCEYSIDNPIGVPPSIGSTRWNGLIGGLLATSLALCLLLSVVSVVLRFRRSRGAQRLQMRWIAFAGVVVAMWVVVSTLTSHGGPDQWWQEIGLTVTVALIPISCGIAIMRYHLYDIDRIISRTTSYAIVTGLVLAVYAVIVTSASRFLHSSSPLVVAAATLAAAALARPALRRVQVVVDRRFDRARYDGARTVDAFGGHLQRTIDAAVVQTELLRTVQESLQPATTALWVNGGTT